MKLLLAFLILMISINAHAITRIVIVEDPCADAKSECTLADRVRFLNRGYESYSRHWDGDVHNFTFTVMNPYDLLEYTAGIPILIQVDIEESNRGLMKSP